MENPLWQQVKMALLQKQQSGQQLTPEEITWLEAETAQGFSTPAYSSEPVPSADGYTHYMRGSPDFSIDPQRMQQMFGPSPASPQGLSIPAILQMLQGKM